MNTELAAESTLVPTTLFGLSLNSITSHLFTFLQNMTTNLLRDLLNRAVPVRTQVEPLLTEIAEEETSYVCTGDKLPGTLSM